MKIISTFTINLKKLKYRTGKALFLIIPIFVLVSLSIVVSSQVKNTQTAMEENIFAEIEEESTVLEIQYPIEQFQFGRGQGGNFGLSENEYTEVDLETIRSIDNVANASINYNLPISNITTSNLFEDIDINLNSISALDDGMSGLYTTENFTYTEGVSIPIILNVNQFVETYEEWGGQEEISIDFRAIRESGENPTQATPIKTRAIDYNKDELLGKEFEITFGGFPEIPGYETTRESGLMTMKKLSGEEVIELKNERANNISQYWNYEQVAAGLTYIFKIVGLIETEGNRTIYVPEGFAQKVMQDYINLQINSRTAAELPNDMLNSTYTGLTYDGTELSASSNFPRIPGGMRGGIAEGQSEESYEIPGLITQVDETDSNEILGLYSDPNVFTDSIKTGNTISIKIDGILLNRTGVVQTLNDLGYAYQDINDIEIFNNVQDTLDTISLGLIIGFIILTVAAITLTMSKFVSESTKEIGIFRAVGFTKGNILSIFLVQSFLYTLVGYGLGIIIGVITNLLAGEIVSRWFSNFVSNTVKEKFNVVGEVDYSIFNGLDYNSFLMLSIILAFITIIISFIPAYRASNISPVEAIKSE